jgi:hypothetical protein
MGNKKGQLEEVSATATLATAKLKVDDMIALTQQRSDVVKNAPGYNNQPDVQKALGAWQGSATSLTTTEQAIKAARVGLVALLATQTKNVAGWRRTLKLLLATITQVSQGSEEAIKLWGFLIAMHQALPASSDAPANLRAEYTRQLALVLRWAGVRGHVGYFVQIGDGTPQGWGTPIPCPKARFEPTGLAPGQKITVRVAVQRKNGLSAWSDALSITVR